MSRRHALLRAILLCCLLPCAAQAQRPRYLDPDADLQARVSDLVGRMTLEEKVSQLMDNAPAIERLGVPEYGWWNEALHGVGRAGLATVFPQAIGMAATWNDSLMLRLATVISDEARAKHHEYARNGRRLRYQGLTIFSPNINIFRDPRWGRGQETYGEDPFLTARLGVQFVRGLQGDDPRYFKTVATVKHYVVHSGPEPERHSFDAVVSQRDLRETYLPHFEVGIREAGAYSIMCAYNRVFGKAACASDTLLQDILRNEWGFRGYVVSDCAAINDIYQNHKIVATAAEAAALALRLGTDLECGRVYRVLVEAVRNGQIRESEIDVALGRLFSARFRLGMFDPPERVKWAQIPYSIVDQPSHRALAREVARESMVLLKNERNVLPLRKDLGTIAVIGPNADDWMMLLGNYNGMPADPITPLRGIREAVGPRTTVLHARGAEISENAPSFHVMPRSVLSQPGGQPGLRVEYFANRDLTGTPLYSATDTVVNVNWAEKSPRADLNVDDFGVRWTGLIRPEHTGPYQIGLIGTMKYELYINDSLTVRSVYPSFRDEFGDPRLRSGASVRLEAGRSYRVRVEAHESYGEAQLQLVWTDDARDLLGEAVRAAQRADAVVMFLGLTPRIEGEEMDVQLPGFRGGDRTAIDLPASQQQLLERIVAIGKPTVLVLLNGSALAVTWAQQNVPAILEAWYPGQAGGTAIADVLFGDYNPAGRLPVTFYRSAADLPAFEDYSMRGRTYRFFEGRPLYPFGHGLSYTTFTYSNIALSAERLVPNGTVTVRANVTNSGRRAGDEVVQLYVQHLASRVARPLKELKGYTRIKLQPGERKSVSFALPASQLAYWDSTTSKWVLENNRVRVMLGASADDIRLNDTIVIAASEPNQPAPLRLPRLFQDGMVLQRGGPIPVWGWASPRAALTVTLNGRSVRAIADANGEWSASLPALQAGGPHTLSVEGGGASITLRDVLVGDVWVASGQSNMEWPLAAATNGAAAAASARDVMLREFAVPHSWSETPQADLSGGSWAEANAQQAGRFSAVAYFFARDLRAATGVPIGIIHSSWGGSNIETWMSRKALGLDDQEWKTIVQGERARDAAIRDSLKARVGDLPTTDAGLVDGRALWADPNLDDSIWKTVPVPSLWEQAGFPGLDGIAWYRTTFSLTDAEAQQGVRIALGMIDDDDIAWVNGTEVGRTTGYAQRRVYTVPAATLRPGSNMLALRVADGGGGGGPYGSADQFYVEAGASKRSLAGSWKFKVGSVSIQADGQRINKISTVLYNQMLHPLLRYPIRGVIWYQGESNANNEAQAAAYKPLFTEMIRSWRREWSGAPREFPFLWVQLPNYGAIDTVPPARAAWATLRESQAAALSLPATAQVVAIDMGDPADIHPRNKEPIGQRLARAARRIAYGESVLASGPTYRSHEVRAGRVVIDFDNIGTGLISRSGDAVRGFAIAGADRRWVWVDARIDGNRVVVTSAQVTAPVAVRYAWSNSPRDPGLFNREGLPAAPFRTDTW